MGNFQPLEVVDRVSEAQPPVVENLNELTEQLNNLGLNLPIWCEINAPEYCEPDIYFRFINSLPFTN